MEIGFSGPKCLMLVFLVVLAATVQAQLPVVSRSFEGQTRTKDSALERRVNHPVGGAVVLYTLEEDVRRLSNYPGIVRAWYTVDTLTAGLHINYHIQEGLTRYPVALLGGLKDNFWWVAGYEDINWQGNANKLSLLARQTDGRLGGRLAFEQFFFRDKKWGLGFQLERYASEEPLYFGLEQVDYLYNNHNIGIQWKYHVTVDKEWQLGYTYFVEDYRKANLLQETGPDAQRESKHLLRAAYRAKRIFYDLQQPSGYDLTFSSEVVLQRQQKEPFYLLRAIGRKYLPSGERGVWASRLTAGYATNRNTPFAPFVLDSRVNIRGSGNRVDRGTGVLVLNAEYRQMLWETPWLLGQAVGFIDVGTWRNPGGRISDLWQSENIRCFSGVGIRLISPYAQQAVFRIDYGFGLHPISTGGVVLGLGQYF